MQNHALILWLWKAFKLTSLIKLLLVISQNLVILLIVAAFTGLGEYSTLQLMLLQNQLLILGVLFVWNKHDIPAHSYTYTQWWNLLYFVNNKAFYSFTFVLVGKSYSVPYFRTILDVCRSDCLPCGSVVLVLMKASIYQHKKKEKGKSTVSFCIPSPKQILQIVGEVF